MMNYKRIKKINNLCLVAIVLIIIIDVFFKNLLDGIYNILSIIILSIAILTSIVIEVILKKKKQNEN